MTKPARSDVNVIGTEEFHAPRKKTVVSVAMPMITATRISVHHPGWMRGSPARRVAMALSRQVEVAGLPVDGQRDRQYHERQDDQRGTHGASDGFAVSGGYPNGGVNVEVVG